MSAEIIDLGSRRPAVTYTVDLVQGWDGSLSVHVRDVADDERSRLSVADALRRAAAALDGSAAGPMFRVADRAGSADDCPSLEPREWWAPAADPLATAELALDRFWAATDAWRAADADPAVPVEDAIRAYARMKAAGAEMQVACVAAFEGA